MRAVSFSFIWQLTEDFRPGDSQREGKNRQGNVGDTSERKVSDTARPTRRLKGTWSRKQVADWPEVAGSKGSFLLRQRKGNKGWALIWGELRGGGLAAESWGSSHSLTSRFSVKGEGVDLLTLSGGWGVEGVQQMLKYPKWSWKFHRNCKLNLQRYQSTPFLSSSSATWVWN